MEADAVKAVKRAQYIHARRQTRTQGIALLSVMIVIAFVSASVGWLLYSQYIEIQRMTRAIVKEQSFLYTLSFEDAVRSILLKEAEDQRPHEKRRDFYALKYGQGQYWSRTDALDLILFQSIPQLTGIEDIQIKIYDMQGFLDLNSLVNTTNACDGKDVRADMQPRFWLRRAFMRMVRDGVSVDELGERITYRILEDSFLDWIDADSKLRTEGAEDATYSLSDIPYHAGNTQFAAADSLYFVRGFRDLPRKNIEEILQYTTVLPAFAARPGCPKPINLLTAPLGLLTTLISELHPALKDTAAVKARELKERICDPPFEDLARMRKVLKEVLLQDIGEGKAANEIRKWVDTVATHVFGLSTRYFMVHIAFNYQGHKNQTNSVFYLRRNFNPDDKIPRIAMIRRYQGADPYADIQLHQGGSAAMCPIPDDDEEEGLEEL